MNSPTKEIIEKAKEIIQKDCWLVTKISHKENLLNGEDIVQVGYWTLGQLINNIKIDEPMFLYRIFNSKHGDSRVDGIFRTSNVKKIVDEPDFSYRFTVETNNSIYRVEKL